jgi:SHS2 domain-containing protein
MVMDQFRVLDHDADIRIEVYGTSRQELFENAARGIFSLLTDPASVRPLVEKKIAVRGNGELFINFLNELLFVWDVERFIPAEVFVDFVPEGANVVLRGESFDEQKHSIRLEMKAVTYHNFMITEDAGLYKATFVIDV